MAAGAVALHFGGLRDAFYLLTLSEDDGLLATAMLQRARDDEDERDAALADAIAVRVVHRLAEATQATE